MNPYQSTVNFAMTFDQLRTQHCVPRKGAGDALDARAVDKYLAELPGWQLSADKSDIRKDFKFKNFHLTMAFVNAMAWIAHQEDHHPDCEIGYGHCLVRFSTHDVGGLSLNDFICAAKVQALSSNA